MSQIALFFFNDTATTEIYTLSLHDALPISGPVIPLCRLRYLGSATTWGFAIYRARDRKSTRLNSSHGYISYAVFCLKKKKKRPIISSLSYESNSHLCNKILI